MKDKEFKQLIDYLQTITVLSMCSLSVLVVTMCTTASK